MVRSLFTRAVHQARLTAQRLRSAPAAADTAAPPGVPTDIQPGRVHVSGFASVAEAQATTQRFPLPELTHIEVRDAVVPGVVMVQNIPRKQYSGAYDSTGALIPQSQDWRRLARGMDCQTLAYDRLPNPTTTLDSGVFGGVLYNHFGHMMIESLARSWWVAENDPARPLVLQFEAPPNLAPAFVGALFTLSGLNPVIVGPNEAVRIKRLVIPDAALIERVFAHPRFLSVFDRIGARVAETQPPSPLGPRLFVTRGKGVAQVFGEDVVRAELERQGYAVLDPTTVSLPEQIAAFAAATHIVGTIGSAMHNVVFARKARKVAYLVRDAFVSTTFPTIDQACARHEAHYLYVGLSPLPVHPQLQGPYLIDPEQALADLHRAGFLPQRAAPKLRDLLASRDAYMQDWARIKKKTDTTA